MSAGVKMARKMSRTVSVNTNPAPLLSELFIMAHFSPLFSYPASLLPPQRTLRISHQDGRILER